MMNQMLSLEQIYQKFCFIDERSVSIGSETFSVPYGTVLELWAFVGETKSVGDTFAQKELISKFSEIFPQAASYKTYNQLLRLSVSNGHKRRDKVRAELKAISDRIFDVRGSQMKLKIPIAIRKFSPKVVKPKPRMMALVPPPRMFPINLPDSGAVENSSISILKMDGEIHLFPVESHAISIVNP